jgi:photosystem II stability/assembly factor-like uncharacterized protein
VGIASSGWAASATSIQARSSLSGVARTILAPLACAEPPVLSLGEDVPTTDLAAVDFLTPNIGVGLVAEALDCPAPTSATAKETVGLARSRDGGQSWALVSTTGPANLTTNRLQPITLAFSSTTTGWVSANGTLDETLDGGHHWRSVRLGSGQVLTVARTGSLVEAVTSGPSYLWTLALPDGHWRNGAPIPTMVGSSANAESLELTSLGPPPNDAVVATRKYGDEPPEVAVTTNGGTSWSWVADPCSHNWAGLGALTQSADGEIGVLCFGGAAAGSGTRGFYVSTNRGRSWVLRAADTNLAGPNPSGLNLQDTGTALGSPRPGLFLDATENLLAVSVDGGRHWKHVAGSPDWGAIGLPGVGGFDVLNATSVWLLARGVALLRTTDGTTWLPL